MTARRLFLIAFAVVLLAGLGCSNDDDSPSAPTMVCADGGDAAANSVNTNCAVALDTVTQQVDVVMGGPAAGTTTLRGLNFDVTYDSTKLSFVSASATSPLFPSALVAVNPQAGRVIVGIQQTGDLGPVTVTPGQYVVFSLTFEVIPIAAFASTPIGLQNTEATSPSQTITFASGTAIAYQ